MLPDELVLEICKHVSHEDLWLSLRNVNQQHRRCVEDVMKRNIREQMNVALNFSIGIGTRHRVLHPPMQYGKRQLADLRQY